MVSPVNKEHRHYINLKSCDNFSTLVISEIWSIIKRSIFEIYQLTLVVQNIYNDN